MSSVKYKRSNDELRMNKFSEENKRSTKSPS